MAHSLLLTCWLGAAEQEITDVTARADVTAGIARGRRAVAQLSVESRDVLCRENRLHGRAFRWESNLWRVRRRRVSFAASCTEERPVERLGDTRIMAG